MDYNLYIIIREDDLEKINVFEKKASWGGEIISYSPKKFLFEDKIFFVSSDVDITYGLKKKGEENLVQLKIVEGLRELEWEVNKNTENLESNDIIRILKKICQLEKFSIIIYEDDEMVEHQIEYTEDKDIGSLVCSALNWESPQNVEIFCK